ncbi:MAG TPA: EAL domain-containing protein [Nocardioides sp.]|nr:EAL domain-containing protein [Nocardioides sp.]
MISSASREERLLRQVIEASPFALLMVDADCRVALVNYGAETLFGYSSDQLLGRHAGELIPEGFRGHPDALTLETGRNLNGVRADGSEVQIELVLNSLETDEGAFLLAAIVDVTEQIDTEESLDEDDDKLAVAKALRRGLDRGELSVVYQPQVELSSGAVVGMEALARWDSPELGPVGPDLFIPVAEDSGMILPLGEWVLRRACLEALAIQAELGRPLGLAVNVSPRQFHAPDWWSVVDEVLTETGFDPSLLELEITEGILMEGPSGVIEQLHAFRAKGIRIVVDDFGTGFSSLSYLTRFPIDKIKIDRSFVREVNLNKADAAIVDTIIGMAHTLGLAVVAEGVETLDQERYLQRRACDGAQGFRYGPGVPAESFVSVAQMVVAI